MRVPSSGDVARVIVALPLACCAIGLAGADVGGGRGYPATPWRVSGPASVQDLEEARVIADQHQALSISAEPAAAGDLDSRQIWKVSLRAEKPLQGESARYALVGRSDSGTTVTLRFSQIESFVVTSSNRKSITLAVTVWPDISPEELLRTKPSYRQLADGYRRTVVLTMDLKSPDGRPLAFAGPGEYGAVIPLEKLGPGTKGDFYAGHPHSVDPRRFWWAIPSIANDKDYPYRMIPMASFERGPAANQG
jgi:hypothetical protein